MLLHRRRVKMATPFVKWAGGKSKLAPVIEDRIEKSIGFENIEHYIEAFAGGGALFFHLVQKYDFKSTTLIDINIELINAYKAIKKEPYKLMDYLDIMQKEYNALGSEEMQSVYFYEVRKKFNNLDDKSILYKTVDFNRAAQFIFLNKTCFNGLYRENNKGKYNVPFGKKKTVNLYELNNILEISGILQNVNIVAGDYTLTKDYLEPKTLVYFDPPYRPITGTAAFTTYSKGGFNDENQIELANFCKEISDLGAYFVLSNSDPYNGDINDNFFDNLYAEFEIHRIYAPRAIAARSSSRKEVTEILIVNEQIEESVEIDLNVELGGTEMLSFEKYNQLGKDEQFTLFMNSLSPTNRTPQYYVNWEKVESKTREIEISLHTLNYLIGKENIYEEALKLFYDQPQLVKTIPVLLAIREHKFKILRIKEQSKFKFDNLNFKDIDTENIRKYVDFAQEAGLLDFLKDKATKSLVDYVFGVEVGLDSNGRKNRSGLFMEKLVEEKIKSICEESGLEYIAQANAIKIKERWGIDIPYKESIRNFDFAIFNESTNNVTIIEVNYYGGGGSKLKSVAGEFAELSSYFFEKAPHIQFIWITDGKGWETANRPLRDAFETIDYIINLKMLNQGYLDKIIIDD